MANFYTTNKISQNLEETPEGYLLCKNVAITKEGDFVYYKQENIFPDLFEGDFVLTRKKEELTKKDTLDSFEGKPITIEHPDVDVVSKNWKDYAVGIMQNVRAGEGEDDGKIIADLLITDIEAIDIIKSKKAREVSLSMRGDVIKTGEESGFAINIRGNHLAIAMDGGRCGKSCSINDSKWGKKMTMKEKIMKAFGKAINDAMPEEGNNSMNDEDGSEIMNLIRALSDRISSLEAMVNKNSDNTNDEDPEMSKDKNTQDGIDMSERLANIEAAILKLAGLATTSETTEDCNVMNDSLTLSRAEILAPGIENCNNIKEKALKEAYKTEYGRKAIDILLDGKTLDSMPDKDTLFIAASEAIKVHRDQNRGNFENKKSNFITNAEDLNAFHQKFYSKG